MREWLDDVDVVAICILRPSNAVASLFTRTSIQRVARRLFLSSPYRHHPRGHDLRRIEGVLGDPRFNRFVACAVDGGGRIACEALLWCGDAEHEASTM